MIGKSHTEQIVLDSLEYFMNLGMTEKMEVYTKVVEETDVARPTVRRIARNLRQYYQSRIDILQNDLVKTTHQTKGSVQK